MACDIFSLYSSINNHDDRSVCRIFIRKFVFVPAAYIINIYNILYCSMHKFRLRNSFKMWATWLYYKKLKKVKIQSSFPLHRPLFDKFVNIWRLWRNMGWPINLDYKHEHRGKLMQVETIWPRCIPSRCRWDIYVDKYSILYNWNELRMQLQSFICGLHRLGENFIKKKNS